MGWWSTDITGGDTPLDILGLLEQEMGVTDLYPLDQIDPITATTVRDYLNDKLHIVRLLRLITPVDSVIATQVLAALVMATGASLPDPLRLLALKAADADPWAQADSDRRHDMDIFAHAVTYYTDTPVTLPHRSLFQSLSDGCP